MSATGSAGTIAAGDHLKSLHGTKIAAVEAIECPTMLCNGYGEHNIQGIGDKHIPLIHNVMNTDLVIGVSDLASDSLNLLFGGNVGRSYMVGRRRIDPEVVGRFDDIGISGLANIVAAIKLAKHLDLGADDVIMTVATDSALLYASERRSFLARRYPDGFDEVNAGEIFSRHLEGIVDDHVLELTHLDRKRIFNLGYYTWVEQQGVAIDDFDRPQGSAILAWAGGQRAAMGSLIEEFNRRSAPSATTESAWQPITPPQGTRDLRPIWSCARDCRVATEACGTRSSPSKTLPRSCATETPSGSAAARCRARPWE